MKEIALIFLVLVLVVVILFFLLGKKSQGGSASGLVNGQLAACPSSPNCVSSEAGTPDKQKTTPFGRVHWTSLKNTIEGLGGTVTESTETYLAAEFRSKIFGFVDDVEVRLDGDVIHIRCASRVGYGDRGVNRKRAEMLKAALEN